MEEGKDEMGEERWDALSDFGEVARADLGFWLVLGVVGRMETGVGGMRARFR